MGGGWGEFCRSSELSGVRPGTWSANSLKFVVHYLKSKAIFLASIKCNVMKMREGERLRYVSRETEKEDKKVGQNTK